LKNTLINNVSCDVLIVGAGPAGLLLAKKIAEHFKVIIIEKREIGNTSKFWMTTQNRLKRHDMLHCEIAHSRQITLGCFMGSTSIATGEASIIDEGILLSTLSARCKKANVLFYEKCEIVSLCWKNDYLFVDIGRTNISCRLLIDCSGGFSIISSTYQLNKIYGFFSVYGAHITNIELNSNSIALAHIIRLGYPPPYFEVIPIDYNSAICAVFISSKRLVDPFSLKEIFEDHINSNPFFKLRKDSVIISNKMGGIPIGKRIKAHVPNIISYGESAMMQSPLMGSAFNEILEYNDLVASQIVQFLGNANTGSDFLDLKYPKLKYICDFIHRIIVRKLLAGNVATFDNIIRKTSKMNPEILFRIISNDLNYSELQHLLSLLY
jgi:flavin-dependent dehydrogenase